VVWLDGWCPIQPSHALPLLVCSVSLQCQTPPPTPPPSPSSCIPSVNELLPLLLPLRSHLSTLSSCHLLSHYLTVYLMSSSSPPPLHCSSPSHPP